MAGDDDKKKQRAPARPKTIVFLHPDLGIGGAERLVVDAAVGLQKRGYRVVIFTSHCDPAHCFEEARDGTLDVHVHGNTLVPPTILGRFAILCAILRQLHLLLHVGLFTSKLATIGPDAFFVDQLSAGLPALKVLLSISSFFSPREGGFIPPIFFYCHFPDLLLARGRAQLWKRLYRAPFDALERWSMGFADAIAVNSAFTRGVVEATWPGLANSKTLHVVYPCVDVSSPTQKKNNTKNKEQNQDKQTNPDETTSPEPSLEIEPLPWAQDGIILSINRFERKKDIALALHAFARLPPSQRKTAKLILAGGYDPRVTENVAYHTELQHLATSLNLHHATAKTLVSAVTLPQNQDTIDVLFLLSVPDLLKEILLRSARLLLYTPRNEHFGIVPLEAMLRGLPVLAANSGGPRETVVDGVTGWLRDPDDVDGWSEVLGKVLNDIPQKELEKMGKAGVERVKDGFGEEKMAETLDGILDQMHAGPLVSNVSVLLAGVVVAVGVLIPVLVVGRIGGHFG
ncbi:glycosyltransferase [Dichotomopilus funicola]|uniref:Alpha-1,3/1,6-mannosyltransferase ALG2 n=1 Tax=Dichotomopilus funicola TaxID=1934379 RepID=A0AAN6V1M8_9PEZI|nr:glycosyltransferase [Dichotomopilus funicola]